VQTEADPLDPDPPEAMRTGLAAILHLERAVTTIEGGEGLVLRYGSFYGPGTGFSLAPDAATLMMTEARGGASNAKAKRELGWQLRFPTWRQGFAQGLG
jgi:hypothetical protein